MKYKDQAQRLSRKRSKNSNTTNPAQTTSTLSCTNVSDKILEAFVKAVEKEADYVSGLAKNNSRQPLGCFEALKTTPIHHHPCLSEVVDRLSSWNITAERLKEAFEKDFTFLETAFCVDPKKSPLLCGDEKAIYGEKSGKVKEEDLELDVHTESSEETDQAYLGDAPYLGPLRQVLRRIKRKERLYHDFGQRLLSLHHPLEPWPPLTEAGKNGSRNKKKKRIGRENYQAARLALWFNAWRPSALVSLEQNRRLIQHMTPDERDQLQRLGILRQPLHDSSFPLIQAVLHTLATNVPYLRDRDALEELNAKSCRTPLSLALIRSPFQWTLWNSDQLLQPKALTKKSEKTVFGITSARKGTRLYLGRAENIWGSPVSEGYQQVTYPMELLLWFNVAAEPFVPLVATFFSKSTPKPHDTVEWSHPPSETLTSHCSFQGEEPSNLSVRVEYEEDSDLSSAESSQAVKPESCSADHFYKYNVDHDLVQLGCLGQLRSCWTSQERVHRQKRWKRTPLQVPQTFQEDESSEDSHMEYIASEAAYRRKRRTIRQRIQDQSSKILKTPCGSELLSQSPKDLYSFLFHHKLEPLDPPFVHPLVQTSHQHLPASCQVGKIQERWTYITHKKPRVKFIQPNISCQSSVPLGFFSKCYDLGHNEYHLLGIDQNEVWRQFGHTKAFQKSLKSYSDFLMGCRDYYAIIDEPQSHVTIVPGAFLSLFWVKTPKQNTYDMHWLAFWKCWSPKQFHRRLIQKYFRYRCLLKQGGFVKKNILERLEKIEDRLRETSAFRRAKETRLNQNYLSMGAQVTASEELGKKGPLLWTSQEIDQVYDHLLNPPTLDVPSSTQQEKAHFETLSEDVKENMRKALVCHMRRLREAQQTTGYPSSLSDDTTSTGVTPPGMCGSKNVCWRKEKEAQCEDLVHHFGPLVSEYYRDAVPSFGPTYDLARHLLGEKLEKNPEPMTKRRPIASRGVDKVPPRHPGDLS